MIKTLKNPFLLAVAISSAPALAIADSVTNIGQVDSGVYLMADENGGKCLLAVGNYGFSTSGRGYAAMDCQQGANPNTNDMQLINNLNIGKLDSGLHSFTAAVDGVSVDCNIAVGNYGFSTSGRGYAAMACDF